MCYRAERGEHNQHRPPKWARDGIRQHGLVLQGSTVQAWVVWWSARHPSTSASLIKWTPALSQILNSARGLDPPQLQQRALLPNSTLNCNNKLKRIVPVTMLQNMNLVLNFESIRLLFCLKVFVWYFFRKYLFAIFLKVFIWYLFLQR